MSENPKSSCGFLYHSYDPKYMDEVFESIRTLQRHNPSANICVITDEKGRQVIDEKYSRVPLDKVLVKKVSRELEWFSKMDLYNFTPYHKTISLDSDTYFTGDIRNLFDLLETFDFVAVPDEAHPARGSVIGLKGGYAALSHYNTGVMLFRKSPMAQKLFEYWKEEYAQLDPVEINDQGPLVRALVRAIGDDGLKFITLPKEYNLRLTNQCVSFQHRVKIVHGRARDPEKLLRMLNDFDYVCTGSRVWLPNLQRVIRVADFRWYERMLRFFNWDNVQKEVHGPRPPRSGWKKLKEMIGIYWEVFRKRGTAGRGAAAFSTFTGNREEWEKQHVALLDFLTSRHEIRSVLDCESFTDHFSKYFEQRGVPTSVLHRSKGALWHRAGEERQFDLAFHCNNGVRADTRRMHHLVRTLCKNSSRFILLINRLLPARRRFDFSMVKTDWYWIQLISDRGFYFDPYLSKKLRELSENKYFKENCLIFERRS